MAGTDPGARVTTVEIGNAEDFRDTGTDDGAAGAVERRQRDEWTMPSTGHPLRTFRVNRAATLSSDPISAGTDEYNRS